MDSNKKYANKESVRNVLVFVIFLMGAVAAYDFNLWLFVLCLWAGYFNAIMDTITHHFTTSIFADKMNDKFWDASISWQNKYSNVSTLTRKKWFKVIPVPVFLSDAWHLFKFFMITCIFIAIADGLNNGFLVNWWCDAIIARACFGIGFTPFYSYFFRK